jgi:hypothetical protein
MRRSLINQVRMKGHETGLYFDPASISRVAGESAAG